MLKGKNILVGVTGGIAAYKVCYLVRELKKLGADVHVMMTEAATKFVTPLTFSALSEHEALTNLWSDDQATGSNVRTRHIDLAISADILVIAPATANTIAKISYGIADNLLTVITLAFRAPVLLAPAMDSDMYLNPVTQKNLSNLSERGYHILPPAEGELASGLIGPGRLPEVETLVASIEAILEKKNEDLKKRRILVTAGPTYERIDPVRFIGNRSSGKMGFALARAAATRGADVTLVAGPVYLETPRHVKRIDVESAKEMHDAVLDSSVGMDAIIMAAAVADFAPKTESDQKIKKTPDGSIPHVELVTTTDILAKIGEKKKNQVLVGFALETDDEHRHALSKLKQKNLDIIVLNSLKDVGAGFGVDTNVVTIFDKDGNEQSLPLLTKHEVANRILDRVRDLLPAES